MIEQSRAVAQRLRIAHVDVKPVFEAANTIDSLCAKVERLKEQVAHISEALTNANKFMHQFATDRDAAQSEVERLTACLAKANSNHEEFERKFYLAQGALENMESLGVENHRLTRALQSIMLMLTRFLDEDQFVTIEQVVMQAGVNPPEPLGETA